MTRLSGPAVSLVPVPVAVARAVTGHDAAATAAALDSVGLRAAYGWPHEDSADGLRSVAESDAGALGTWLVVQDGQVVGDCGWFGPPGDDGVVEIGYGLAAPSRGQGLGTEAVALLVTWAEQQPGVRAVAAEVLPGSEPSMRLLARLGFTESGSNPPYVRLVRAAPGV